MATKLMKQECSENCKEQCEFLLRFVVEKLSLTDSEKSRGFEDIVLNLTLDSNVIKIDNIQSSDENVLIQREFYFLTTPEYFARKLKRSPIIINLVRECADLGTIKLEITDCFSDAVLCDDFSSERMICEYKFLKDGTENASMELSIEVARDTVDNETMKDFLRSNAKQRERKRNNIKQTYENYDASISSMSSFMCDADLIEELCPLEDKTFHSSSIKSKNSKDSKCVSDIAASLDVNKFKDDQKVFCRGCRGFSISGITCENKNVKIKHDLKNSKSRKSLQSTRKNSNEIFCRPVNRICSQCFADLTVLGKNSPCPNCSCIKKYQNDDKKRKSKKMDVDTSPSYFQRMLKEILNDQKKIYKRGLDIKTAKPKKKQKAKGKFTMSSKCNKVKRVNEISNVRNKSLRIKNYGVVLGHNDCQNNSLLVPKNMGWLWNAKNPGISKIRRGWKPGAVPKSVAKMMKFFLKKECEPQGEGDNWIEIMNENPPSTLKVEKKFGEYTITLNPLCDKSFGEDATPIVFQVSKTENNRRRSDAKRFLKYRGVTKTCKCSNITDCFCMDESKKQEVLYELRTISDVMYIYPPMKYEELSDESECSEIDFEFTPPFEMMNKCKRDVRVSVAATQYEEPISEKFDETEESSEPEIVVKKKKVKKNVKSKGKKVVKKLSDSRSKHPGNILREIKSNKCISYCRPNLQCEFGDRSTTNYNPLYTRCLPNYSVCPPRQCCNSLNNYFNLMNF